MGSSNALRAYALYAGKIPPLSMQILGYMALVSIDADSTPWFGAGDEALALFALGRPDPIQPADLKAVERAKKPLIKIGAITTERKAARRKNAPSTARYQLHLNLLTAVDMTLMANPEAS